MKARSIKKITKKNVDLLDLLFRSIQNKDHVNESDESNEHDETNETDESNDLITPERDVKTTTSLTTTIKREKCDQIKSKEQNEQNERNERKKPQPCFFCGSVWANSLLHQKNCVYRDERIVSPFGAIKNVAQMIKDGNLKCIFVIVSANQTSQLLTQLYYHIFKSINPSFFVVVVPFVTSFDETLKLFVSQQWYRNLPELKIFACLLNCENKYEQCVQNIKFFSHKMESLEMKKTFCLFFDNWCNVDKKVINESLKKMTAKKFPDWMYSQVEIGNCLINKIEKIKSLILSTGICNNQEILSNTIGSMFIYQGNFKRYFDPIITNSKKNHFKRLLFCPNDQELLVDDTICSLCKQKLETKKCLTSCIFCSNLFLSANVSKHEKRCSDFYKNVDDPSSFVLLISIGFDGLVRSNLFYDLLAACDFIDDSQLIVSRMHLNNLSELEKSLSRCPLFSLNERDKTNAKQVFVFVFCDQDDGTKIISDSLLTESSVPHLFNVHISVRIQLYEICNSYSHLIFPLRNSISFVTNNFRYLQIIQIYKIMIKNFIHALNYLLSQNGVGSGSSSSEPNGLTGLIQKPTIFPKFIEWYKSNKHVFATDEISFDSLFDSFCSFESCQKKQFLILLMSLGMIPDQDNKIKPNPYFDKIFDLPMSLFEKNLDQSIKLKRKASSTKNVSKSLKISE